MAVQDKLEISLNQNVWMLIISLASLGCAEYYKLQKLTWFSNYLCWLSCISITVTVFAYTFSYVKNKFKKNNSN
jgi:hypothetical protein